MLPTLPWIFLASWAFPRAAAVSLPMTPSELCRRADRIVLAEATTAETYWGDDGLIRTRTWFTVVADLKEAGPRSETVEIDLPGGRMGDLALVPDVPTFVADHAYLLHLTVLPSGGTILTSLRGVVAIASPREAAPALSAKVKEVCHGR